MKDEISINEFKSYTEKSLQKIKCLNQNQIKILWFNEFCDGPLNGILKYNQKEYGFEIVTDYTKNIYPRIFAIFSLTENEFKEEKYWNELYIKLIKNQPENENITNYSLTKKSQKKYQIIVKKKFCGIFRKNNKKTVSKINFVFKIFTT